MLLNILFTGVVLFASSTQIIMATDKFGSSSWAQAVRDIFRVIAQVTLVAIGYGVSGMVGGMVMANLIVAPALFYYTGIRPQFPTRDTLHEIWSFAKSSIPDYFIGTALDRLDVLLLGFFIGSGVVGQYEVADRKSVV